MDFAAGAGLLDPFFDDPFVDDPDEDDPDSDDPDDEEPDEEEPEDDPDEPEPESLDLPADVLDSFAATLPESGDADGASDLSPPPAALTAPARESVR